MLVQKEFSENCATEQVNLPGRHRGDASYRLTRSHCAASLTPTKKT